MHGITAARPLARMTAALAVVSGLAVAGCSGSTTAPPGSPVSTASAVSTASPVPASAISRLTAIARRAASENGDSTPSWVTAVLTTHAKALTSATPGDFEPSGGNVKVFLVTMRGKFTDDAATGPPGAAAPTGRYLSIVVNASTFQVTDFGLSRNPPPVSPASLGPVTYLRA
jgi:hypothetical protein